MNITTSIRSFMAAGALSLCTMPIAAMELVNKPGTPVNSGEFGAAVAREGFYTLAASDASGSVDESYNSDGINARNGAIHLLNDWGGVTTYQYLHTHERLVANGFSYEADANVNPIPMSLGSNVALSDRWIVATMKYFPGKGFGGTPALFIAERKQLNGPRCPKVNGEIDCTGVIEPLLLTEADINLGRDNFSIAATDKHIAYADGRSGVIQAMTYNEQTKTWEKTSNFSQIEVLDFNYRVKVQMTDDFLIVAAPTRPDQPTAGKVYYARWLAREGKWSELQSISGGNRNHYFAASVAINDDGDVVISSGNESIPGQGSLTFYEVKGLKDDSYFHLDYHWTHEMYNPVPHVAMDGNQVIAFVAGSSQNIVALRKHTFYISGKWVDYSWQSFGHLDIDLANSLGDQSLPQANFYPSEMDLSQGVSAIGWRGLNRRVDDVKVQNAGAVLRTRFGEFFATGADLMGLYSENWPLGVVLDEENAIVPENGELFGKVFNSLNVGILRAGWSNNARTPTHLQWPIEVSETSERQMCIRHWNVSGENVTVVVTLDGDAETVVIIPPTPNQQFVEQCTAINTEAGIHTLGIYGWDEFFLIDQITFR